jgi:hypothetical protein
MFHKSWNQLKIFEKVMHVSHAGEVFWVENVMNIQKIGIDSRYLSVAKMTIQI